MSRYRTQSVSVAGTVQTSCPLCGCGFAVDFHHAEEIDAGPDVRARAVRYATRYRTEPFTAYPCPACSRRSPRRVGYDRRQGDSAVAIVAAMAAAVALVFLVPKPDNHPLGAPIGVACIAVIALAVHLVVGLTYGYAVSPATRTQAEEFLAAGRIRILAADGPRPALPRRGPPYALLGVAAGFALVPVVEYQFGRYGPVNHRVNPPVVAPGDRVRVDLDGAISSIDGLWRGEKATAVLRNADEFDPKPQVAVSSAQWEPGNILVTQSKPGAEKTSSPWVDVKLPRDPALAGRTLDLDLRVEATYPRWGDGTANRTATAVFVRRVPLRVATAEQQQEFRDVLVWFTLAAAGLVAAAGGWLYWADVRLKRLPAPVVNVRAVNVYE